MCWQTLIPTNTPVNKWNSWGLASLLSAIETVSNLHSLEMRSVMIASENLKKCMCCVSVGKGKDNIKARKTTQECLKSVLCVQNTSLLVSGLRMENNGKLTMEELDPKGLLDSKTPAWQGTDECGGQTESSHLLKSWLTHRYTHIQDLSLGQRKRKQMSDKLIRENIQLSGSHFACSKRPWKWDGFIILNNTLFYSYVYRELQWEQGDWVFLLESLPLLL